MESSTLLSKLVNLEKLILLSFPKCCVKFITHPTEYRTTCGNVPTLGNVKFGFISGVLSRERVRSFVSIEKHTIFFNGKQIMSTKEEQTTLTKISEAEYRMKFHLGEQNKPYDQSGKV